jgi:hypothetical protein
MMVVKDWSRRPVAMLEKVGEEEDSMEVIH